MQYKYVKKCDCCDNLVSFYRIALSPIHHIKRLHFLMQEELIRLGMQGDLLLAHTDDLIVAFNYTYENATELERSEEVCTVLAKVAADFSWNLVSTPPMNYYSG